MSPAQEPPNAPQRMWSDAESGDWEFLGMDARLEGCFLAFPDGALQVTPLGSVLLCSHIPVCLFGLSPALFSVCASCCVFLGLFVT